MRESLALVTHGLCFRRARRHPAGGAEFTFVVDDLGILYQPREDHHTWADRLAIRPGTSRLWMRNRLGCPSLRPIALAIGRGEAKTSPALPPTGHVSSLSGPVELQ